MKTQIKQAPAYFIDENKVVYNTGGDVMTEENGIVRLLKDGLRRRFKVSELTPLKGGMTMDLDKNLEPVIAEAPESTPEKPPKVKKEKIARGEGVIATIFASIATKPISEEKILEILVAKFPGKSKDSMSKTIKVQICGKTRPLRMEKEKNVTFSIKVKDGVKYFSR